MIKEVDEIPASKAAANESRRQRLHDDIHYAWEHGIIRFSFEGYDDWKYLRQYAREVANNFFASLIRKESRRVHEELKLCKYNFAHNFSSGRDWYRLTRDKESGKVYMEFLVHDGWEEKVRNEYIAWANDYNKRMEKVERKNDR